MPTSICRLASKLLFASLLVAALLLATVGGGAACQRSQALPTHPDEAAGSQVAPTHSDAPAAKPETPATSTSSPRDVAEPSLQYLERVTGGASSGDRLPLVVAIHGMGDRPENWLDVWDDFPRRVRVILPRAPAPYGSGFSWFHYPPKSVEDVSREIRDAGDRVARLLTEIEKARPTSGKPIVTGFSQGGFLSFALAVDHGGEIAAAFPMSGGFPSPLWPTTPAPPDGPPIFAVHGDADTVVRIGPTRKAVAKLKELGFHVELKEYPGVGHTTLPSMQHEIRDRIVALVDAMAPAAK